MNRRTPRIRPFLLNTPTKETNPSSPHTTHTDTAINHHYAPGEATQRSHSVMAEFYILTQTNPSPLCPPKPRPNPRTSPYTYSPRHQTNNKTKPNHAMQSHNITPRPRGELYPRLNHPICFHLLVLITRMIPCTCRHLPLHLSPPSQASRASNNLPFGKKLPPSLFAHPNVLRQEQAFLLSPHRSDIIPSQQKKPWTKMGIGAALRI